MLQLEHFGKSGILFLCLLFYIRNFSTYLNRPQNMLKNIKFAYTLQVTYLLKKEKNQLFTDLEKHKFCKISKNRQMFFLAFFAKW